MANGADPDQLVSSIDLHVHCLQRKGISGFSRTRVKSTSRKHVYIILTPLNPTFI